MFGRFSVWILELIAGGPEELVAVVTDGLWTVAHDHAPAGSPVSVRRPRRGYICPGQRDEKASTGCRNSLLASVSSGADLGPRLGQAAPAVLATADLPNARRPAGGAAAGWRGGGH